ncbi:MAG TPA: hypothetical protein VN719_01265 [Gemmatimonadales bacterium]|jgi:hypothetical protein|nr:hypothetical protein [Gemmatimonadales bacterium]HXT42541.1 hypothetical protein [Pseudonocardiaceae bacterium]
MMTPYLLLASSAVLPVLGAMAGDVSKDIAKDLLKNPVVKQIRLLFKRHPDEPTGPEALTPGQANRVREQRCARAGVGRGGAGLRARPQRSGAQ